MTPAQCRAGRALLDWKGQDLAERACVQPCTISAFERGRTTRLQGETLSAIQETFHRAGVRFIEDRGVSL